MSFGGGWEEFFWLKRLDFGIMGVYFIFPAGFRACQICRFVREYGDTDLYWFCFGISRFLRACIRACGEDSIYST